MASQEEDNKLECISNVNKEQDRYYLNVIYKKYESILNDKSEHFENKVQSLIEVWKSISELNFSQFDIKYIIQIIDWAKLHALNIVLTGEWRSTKESFRDGLLQFIEKAQASLASVSDAFSTRCQKLADVVKKPWEDPILYNLIHDREAEIGSKEIEFFCVETGYLVSVRLKKLCENHCEDLALNLVTNYLKCKTQAAIQNFNLNATETQLWFIFDIYVALLYKFHDKPKILEQFGELEIPEGVQLIKRFAKKRVKISKIWRNCNKIAIFGSRYFLSKTLYKYNDDMKEYLTDLLKTYLALSNTETLLEEFVVSVRNLTNLADAEGLCIMCEVTHREAAERLRTFAIEMYIRALTTDMNELERLKHVNEENKMKTTTSRLARTFSNLAELLDDHVKVARECVLTAFSLEPTKERLKQIEELAKRSGFPVLDTGQEWKCRLHPPVLPSDDLAWVCPECGEWMCKPELTTRLQMNTPLQEALQESVLGISEALCDDLVVCLSNPRYQILSWLLSWGDLYRLCILYMNDPEKTKNFVTELKFVDVDYSMFEHIKREPVDEYTGIEKGYEQYLDLDFVSDEETSSVSEDSTSHDRSVSLGSDGTGDSFPPLPQPKSDPNTLKSLRMFRPNLKRKKEESGPQTKDKKVAVQIHNNSSSTASSFGNLTSRSITSNYLPEDAGVTTVGTSAGGNFSSAYDYSAKPDRSLFSNEDAAAVAVMLPSTSSFEPLRNHTLSASIIPQPVNSVFNTTNLSSVTSTSYVSNIIKSSLTFGVPKIATETPPSNASQQSILNMQNHGSGIKQPEATYSKAGSFATPNAVAKKNTTWCSSKQQGTFITPSTIVQKNPKPAHKNQSSLTASSSKNRVSHGSVGKNAATHIVNDLDALLKEVVKDIDADSNQTVRTDSKNGVAATLPQLGGQVANTHKQLIQVPQQQSCSLNQMQTKSLPEMFSPSGTKDACKMKLRSSSKQGKLSPNGEISGLAKKRKQTEESSVSPGKGTFKIMELSVKIAKLNPEKYNNNNNKSQGPPKLVGKPSETTETTISLNNITKQFSCSVLPIQSKEHTHLLKQQNPLTTPPPKLSQTPPKQLEGHIAQIETPVTSPNHPKCPLDYVTRKKIIIMRTTSNQPTATIAIPQHSLKPEHLTPLQAKSQLQIEDPVVAVAAAAAVPQVQIAFQQESPTLPCQKGQCSSPREAIQADNSRARSQKITVLTIRKSHPAANIQRLLVVAQEKVKEILAKASFLQEPYKSTIKPLELQDICTARKKEEVCSQPSNQTKEALSICRDSSKSLAVTTTDCDKDKVQNYDKKTDSTETMQDAPSELEKTDQPESSVESKVSSLIEKKRNNYILKQITDDWEESNTPNVRDVVMTTANMASEKKKVSMSDNKNRAEVGTCSTTKETMENVNKSLDCDNENGTDFHTEVADECDSTDSLIEVVEWFQCTLKTNTKDKRESRKDKYIGTKLDNNSINVVANRYSDLVKIQNHDQTSDQINSIHLARGAFSEQNKDASEAKECTNNKDIHVAPIESHDVDEQHDHINDQNITVCKKACSVDSEELIQIQAVITKESFNPDNSAKADRKKIHPKTPTGSQKIVKQTIVKAVNDCNVKNTRLRITLQQQKAIKSKDKKCCKDVVFEPPTSKIRLAIKKDPDLNKENIKKSSSHETTPQARSRFKILVDKHVHPSRKRKCDELGVEKKGYNPKRQLIVPLKRLPEVVARPNVKVLVTDPSVSIEDDLSKKTMPLADCNIRTKVKRKMDVKAKKRHAKDLPNTSIGRSSGFHLSIYEDKFYSMLAQVNRLGGGGGNSGSMRIPGLNDYSVFLPRNVNHIVNVVQHTVPRSSNVTNQNTQTSTQVTPHIQRIGQPKLPACSKPDHYEEDLEQAPSSSTVASSTSSTSQSSTLINILSSPKPGQKSVQSRQAPYVNILSQQIVRPTTSSITPPTTTTTTTTTTVIKVEPEDHTEVQATKSVNTNLRIVTTTTQAGGATTTSSTPAQGGTILQFICKSSSLPKFQQAFGKTVYQTGVTPIEGASEPSEVSTNDSSNQSQQTTTTTTVVETKKIAAKALPVNVQPITGNVIFRGQVPVGQTVSLIPPGSNTRQLFRITGSTHEQISLVKETVIQNKMSALLAAALQGKPKITEQNGELVEEYSATRITLCRPGTVPPNATRIVKPVQLQIPANVIRAPQPNVSSTTLEQLREFDMVYKQVKERSSNPAQPETSSQSGQESPQQQQLLQQQQQQRISFTYVNQVQKYTQLAPVVVVSSYSPIQQQTVSPALSVASQGISGSCLTQVSTVAVPKVAVKSSKGKSIKGGSVAKTSPTTVPAAIPKPQQKPQEDEHTTQRIFDILAEYAEQLRNSPDLNNKPAPRRRSNPPTNPSSNTSSSSSCKKKKKKSGSSTTSNLVETDNEDLTMGSEDSSGGNVVQLSMTDEEQSQSASITPPESNLEPATSNTPTPRSLIVTDSSNQPRNVIIADSSVGEALKMPNTALLMPGNYIMPVSVVKGGQQIAVVSGGSKILTTVPARSGQNMLLFQSFVNQNKKGGISAVKYSTLQPFPGHSSQNVQGVSAHTPVVLPSNSVTTVALGQPITLKKIDDGERRGSNTELLLTISQPKVEKSPDIPQPDSSTSLSCDTVDVKIEESSPSDSSSNEVLNNIQKTNSVATSVIASIIKKEENDCCHASSIIKVEEPSKQAERVGSVLVNASTSNGPMLSHTNTRYRKPTEDVESTTTSSKEFNHVTGKVPQPAKIFKNNAVYYAIRTKKTINKKIDSEMQKQAAIERELRLQKTLSEECEDLGVDEPSTSDLFPEADLLFDSNHSPSYDQSSQKIQGTAEAKVKDSMHLFSDYENSGPLRNDLFDYVEYHPRPPPPPPPPRPEIGVDQMNGNNASNESSSSSSCDDSTLLSNCGTMSEVTLNSPISPEYSESSHTINKYKYKYTNRKKGEKVIKLHSEIWQDVTSEVTSSEDAVELIKEDETPIAIQEETVIEEAVTEVETVVLEHPKMSETDLTNRCPIHSSVDNRGSRKATKKTCSCFNGSKSPSVSSAKRRVTFPKSSGPTSSKKLLPSKRR